jgi:hypothetical protein
MVASDETQIPLLTDIVEGANSFESIPRRNRSQAEATMDIETTIAELQTRLASRTYALTDELLRAAFADMEASVFRQVSSRLRQQLPELIDSVLREQLKQDGD